jgi:hypothetical protein
MARYDQMIAFAAQAAPGAGPTAYAALIDEAISRFLRAYGVNAVARDLRVELRHASPANPGEPMHVEAHRNEAGEGLNISVFGPDGSVRAQALVRAATPAAPLQPPFDQGRVSALEARLAAYEQAHADLYQRIDALEAAAYQRTIDDAARDAAWRLNDEFAEPVAAYDERRVRHVAPPAEPLPRQPGYVWRQVRVVEDAPPPPPAPQPAAPQPERRYVWRRVRVVEDETPPQRITAPADPIDAPPPADPGFVWRRVRVVDEVQ